MSGDHLSDAERHPLLSDQGRALLKHLGFPFKAVDDAKAQRGVKIQFKSKSAAKAAAKRK